jgi:hypothetical protein
MRYLHISANDIKVLSAEKKNCGEFVDSNNKTYLGLNVKCSIFPSDLKKKRVSRHIFI